jgi:hypothetical protein
MASLCCHMCECTSAVYAPNRQLCEHARAIASRAILAGLLACCGARLPFSICEAPSPVSHACGRHSSLCAYGLVLAVSGGFLWAAALSAGSTMVYYALTRASLIRLRQLRPDSDVLRIPMGYELSVLGATISVALLTGLKHSKLLLMCVTVSIAAVNWLWANRHYNQPKHRM